MEQQPLMPVGVLTDANLPLLYRLADTTANTAQRQFFTLLGAELLLLSLGTFTGLFTAFFPSLSPVTILHLIVPALPLAELVAAGLILVALVMRVVRLSRHSDTRWYEARAVAESAKSIAWRYAVGGRPFELNKDQRVVDALVLQRLRETLTDVAQKSRTITFTEQGQITDTMRALRTHDLALRQEAYRGGRIVDQHKWYDRKQRWNHDRALLLNWSLVLLEGLGVVCAGLQAFKIVPLNLQALAASLVGGGIAWMQARRYQDLSASYRVAANEAFALERALGQQATEDAWAQFVDNAEDAFSREHRLWRATRDE